MNREKPIIGIESQKKYIYIYGLPEGKLPLL